MCQSDSRAVKTGWLAARQLNRRAGEPSARRAPFMQNLQRAERARCRRARHNELGAGFKGARPPVEGPPRRAFDCGANGIALAVVVAVVVVVVASFGAAEPMLADRRTIGWLAARSELTHSWLAGRPIIGHSLGACQSASAPTH